MWARVAVYLNKDKPPQGRILSFDNRKNPLGWYLDPFPPSLTIREDWRRIEAFSESQPIPGIAVISVAIEVITEMIAPEEASVTL